MDTKPVFGGAGAWGPRSKASTPGPDPLHREPTLAEMLSLPDWKNLAVETIALLFAIFAARAWAFENAASGDYYWIAVLLISSQYGLLGGAFAALAATGFYFMGGFPARTAALDFYDYAGVVLGPPAAWSGIALFLGGLRSLHISHFACLQDENRAAVMQTERLAEALEKALAANRALEKQIATDAATVGAVLRSFAGLDMTSKRAAAASFSSLIRDFAGATAFTIYLKDRGGFEPIHAVDGDRTLNVQNCPPLEKSILQALEGASGRSASTALEATEKLGVLIRNPGKGEALGAVVCQASSLSRDIESAGKRLEQLSRAIGPVLSRWA
jgi:hypothetical protein